jgi:hypothetical protein
MRVQDGVAIVTVNNSPVNANPWVPFDHVEVYLQNALFAEDEFGHRYQCDLCALAEDRVARSEDRFFTSCCVIVEAPRVLTFQIVLGGDLDLVPIESMVPVELRVLCGDYSVLEIGRDLAERNECPVWTGFTRPPSRAQSAKTEGRSSPTKKLRPD